MTLEEQDDASSSSSSSSSSSDDEDNFFGGKGTSSNITEAEREDLIRKKLLESFYGGKEDDDEEDQDKHGGANRSQNNEVSNAVAAAALSEDIDGEAEARMGVAPSDILQDHARHSTITPRNTAKVLQGERRPRGTDADSQDSNEDSGMPMSAAGQSSVPSPPRPPRQTSTNLDSPHFDAQRYTRNLLDNSYAETLLAENEKLSTDIRGLDSTMQTLVYENYSKFIDATDAIRSIGRSVDASESGLRRLSESIELIDSAATSVDTALRTSREAVAEKVRVRRLLRRLDALLRLPDTLRQEISRGQYRLAAKSHYNAAHILAKHSEGFESLSRIELECCEIMEEMKVDLVDNLWRWSGHKKNNKNKNQSTAASAGMSMPEDGSGSGTTAGSRRGSAVTPLPPTTNPIDDPANSTSTSVSTSSTTKKTKPAAPRNVADIFECAGTLLLFASEEGVVLPTTSTTIHAETKEENTNQSQNDDDNDNDAVAPSTYKHLALAAATHLLQETLQSAAASKKKNKIVKKGTMRRPLPPTHRRTQQEEEEEKNNSNNNNTEAGTEFVVPREFMDGLLEAATLFGVTFGSSSSSSSTTKDFDVEAENRHMLGTFVTDLFASFLAYARKRLVEQTRAAAKAASAASARYAPKKKKKKKKKTFGNEDDEEEEEEEEDLQEEMRALERQFQLPSSPFDNKHASSSSSPENAGFDRISLDLTLLIRAVRELARGLALPEVGLDPQVASNLVDQTTRLAEGLVRKQVLGLFVDLRRVTVEKCLKPFVMDAVLGRRELLEDGGAGAGAGGVGDGSGGGLEELGLPPTSSNEEETKMDKKEHGENLLADETTTPELDVVQLAYSAMSDIIQTADGAITDMSAKLSSAPVDRTMIRRALKMQSRRYALWLASALEVLAGCDVGLEHSTATMMVTTGKAGGKNKGRDRGGGGEGAFNDVDQVLLDVIDAKDHEEEEEEVVPGGNALDEYDAGDADVLGLEGEDGDRLSLAAAAAAAAAGEEEGGVENDPVWSLYLEIWGHEEEKDGDGDDDEDGKDEISGEEEGKANDEDEDQQPKRHESTLTLAAAEACRLAESRVGEAMERSIASVLGGSATTGGSTAASSSRGGLNRAMSSSSDPDSAAAEAVSKRFRTASTRVLSLYATSRGAEAASAAREAFAALNTESEDNDQNEEDTDGYDDDHYEPCEPIRRILIIARNTFVDCSQVFGGTRTSGPLPTFDVNTMAPTPYTLSGSIMGGGGGLGGAATSSNVRGLQLDVERMFTERAPIYSRVDFTRNSVVSSVFAIALGSMVEYARMSRRFTAKTVQQLRIDVEFLRHMIPHYVDDVDRDDFHHEKATLYRLLDDVMMHAMERCVLGDETLLEEGMVLSHLRNFMDDNLDVCYEFIIPEEDEGDEVGVDGL